MNTRQSLALGVERIGLWALEKPVAILAIIACLSVVAFYGISNLRTEDAMTDLLRSHTHEYQDYERFRRLFPTEELDAIAVAEFSGPLTAERIEQLREIHFELGLADGVSNVLSMFSVHARERNGGPLVPVIPEELPQGEEYSELVRMLQTDKRFAGRFYAQRNNGESLALFVAALDQKAVEAVVKSLATEAAKLGHTFNLRLGLAGASVMKAELLAATRRDSMVFNIAGFLLGFFLCLGFFQRWQYVAIVLVPTILAVVFSLGLIGLSDVSLNPLMNTIIPLVMVISFANALHLVFAMRRKIADGRSADEAIEHAVLKVGPACILSALTTAIAFASLALTDSHLIKVFGLAAAAATSVSLLLVTLTVPALGALILRRGIKRKIRSLTPQFSDRFDEFCSDLSAVLAVNHRVVWAVTLFALIVFTTAYMQLEPRYRISDIIPDRGPAAHYANKLNANFKGTNAVHVVIWSETGLGNRSETVFSALAQVQDFMESNGKLGNVRSLQDLRESLLKDGKPLSFDELLAELPENLSSRFVSADRRATVVTASMRDLEAKSTNGLRKDLEKNLRIQIKDTPGLHYMVTGLATLSAERAIDTISSLNRSMILAIAIVLVIMGLLFRSFQVALFSLCANMFAVVATGFCLFLFDVGLQYVSVVGLTVAFGLAVDDTVHFLNRYWQERTGGAGAVRAVRTAVERVGPVLLLTTIVIVSGLAATLTSDVPPTRVFGTICMATLVFALIGDVVVLPGAILMYQRTWPFGFWARVLKWRSASR